MANLSRFLLASPLWMNRRICNQSRWSETAIVFDTFKKDVRTTKQNGESHNGKKMRGKERL